MTAWRKIWALAQTNRRPRGRLALAVHPTARAPRQVRLLAALHHGNEAETRSIMYDHMCAAQTYLETCEAELTNRFLRLDRP